MTERQHTTGKPSERPKGAKHAGSVSHPNKITGGMAKHTTQKASSKGSEIAEEDKFLEGFRQLDDGGEFLRRWAKIETAKVAAAAAELTRSAESAEKVSADFDSRLQSSLQDISDLLGGSQILGGVINTELDAHELLHRGLPRAALSSLVDKIHFITSDEASEAIGMSLRTLQRHKSTPAEHLDVQQSGRAWKFAEVLAKATRVLGSQEEAEQWLKRPAIGLDQQRPIDLLTTPAGVTLVEDYLGRLEYDVYT
jgi:putative toxin-antitoxin system antitoxin component (TIGR02293 family)